MYPLTNSLLKQYHHLSHELTIETFYEDDVAHQSGTKAWWANKVDISNSITSLNWTPMLEWYMAS